LRAKFNKTSLDGYLSQRWARIFLLLSVVIIFYLTLYPFDFRRPPTSFDWSIPFFAHRHHSLTDLLSNFFFFIPLGLFWRLSWPKKGGGLGPTLAVALTLSLGVETLQRFVPSRNPALADSIMNVSGALVGWLMAPVWRFLPKIKKRDRLLALFLGFYLLFEPFVFTFDWGEIKAHLKHTCFTFSFTNTFLPPLFLAYAAIDLSLFYALLGAASLEFLRIFVPAVTLNPIESFFRLLLLGIFFLILKANQKEVRKRFFGLFFLAYFLESLTPFNFSWPQGIPLKNLIPFALYFSHFNLAAFFNIFCLLFLFYFFGFLGGNPWQAMGLVALAEGAQLFLPGCYPDLTTPFLAFLGALVGQKMSQRRSHGL